MVLGLPWLGLLFRGDALAASNHGNIAGALAADSVARCRQAQSFALGDVKAGETYGLVITLLGGRLAASDRLQRCSLWIGSDRISKELHAGEPGYVFTVIGLAQTAPRLGIARLDQQAGAPLEVRFESTHMPLSLKRIVPRSRPSPTTPGSRRTSCGWAVMSTARPTTSITSRTRKRAGGLDWFRFEVKEEKPILVYFQLDLLDRDVSANLRVYTVDAKTGGPSRTQGKDPMEIVHDRERERYSKHISRTLTRGLITSR